MATEDISRLFLASLLSIAPEANIAIDDEQRITTFNEGLRTHLDGAAMKF